MINYEIKLDFHLQLLRRGVGSCGGSLEQLGKQFAGGAAGKGTVTVLASGATVDQLAARGAFESVGQHQLRGRDNAIEVFQLR